VREGSGGGGVNKLKESLLRTTARVPIPEPVEDGIQVQSFRYKPDKVTERFLAGLTSTEDLA